MVLTESMFGAEAMEAEGGVAFEAMKVAQLKEELAARGSTRTGLKASLQRWLHGLLVQGTGPRSQHMQRKRRSAGATDADGDVSEGQRPPAAAAPDGKRARRGSRGSQ